MVKLSLLEPFISYKTRPPMFAPETPRSIKKGQLYMVLAPNIEQELKYIAENKELIFRNLYRYFIDKRVTLTLYGKGRQVSIMNEDGDITKLFNQYHRGNLTKVNGITSYLPNNRTEVLRGMNVLFEINYLSERILFNEKDKRLTSYRTEQFYKELVSKVTELHSEKSYVGKYTTNLFIPLELWLDKEELSNPAKLLRPATKSVIGKLLQLILYNKKTVEKFQNIYVVCRNLVLPIRYEETNPVIALSQEAYQKEMTNLLTRFCMKSKNLRAKDEDTQAVNKLAEAEKKTTVEDTTDTVLKSAKIDPDSLTPETKEKVTEVINKAVPNPKLKEVNTKQKPSDPELEEEITLSPDKDIVTDPNDVDILLTAKIEGQSIQSTKRNQILKEKYKTISVGDVPLIDIITDEKSYDVPEQKILAHTVNEDMKSIKGAMLDESYNKNIALKDLTNILMHFSHVDPALYITKDIKVEDASTPTDRMIRYTVEFEDTNRKRHKFPFLLPKMYKEKYLFLNDQKMNLLHQKLPYPVTKVSPNKCQAVTNYKKIFTERYGANLSPRITRLIKILLSPDCPKSVRIEKGNATAFNKTYLTTVEFDELASSMVSLQVGKNLKNRLKIYFNLEEAELNVGVDQIPVVKDPIETQSLLPIGLETNENRTNRYYFSGVTNFIYDQNGTKLGELSEFILSKIHENEPRFQELLKETNIGTKFMYSRSKVMDEYIPTILMLGAADPNGLLGVLEKSKIPYQFVDARKDIPKVENKDDQGIIPFQDGFLVFPRYPFENSLLLNGLAMFPSKEYNFYDMNTRDTYVEIFDDLYSRRNLVDALQNFYYMFIDPITMDILIRLNMPVDFTELMLYCNDCLADNTFQIDSDYHNSRIRSNEIIYAHLYRFLAEAWGNWRLGRQEKFSIREDAVIKELLTSNIVDPHSELNIMLETENDRQVKLKGPSGMNEDRSFTLEKRAYHPSMKGIIGMNTTPSGEVGINRHLVLNPDILDNRGMIKLDNGKDMTGSQLATPAELMQSFGPESSDVERLAMAISQSKHVVPVESSVACPVSYDMERVIPYISSDYAAIAKKDGKVISIENDVMIIQYADGELDDVDLGVHPAKNTDGGFYIMNQMTTDLKVGDKVTTNQIVAYDPKYINKDSDSFGDPLAVMGTMARVAVETNGGVYEDACYITDELAHRMKTKITKQKRVILSRFANIKKMVKIGDHVKANDALMTFDDTSDEFTSQMLAQMAEEAGDDDEIQATNAPIISKYTGVIRDIRIYYTIPIDQMTPSMQKVVNNYIKDCSKREKTISKYKNIYDANTLVKTTEQLVPDSTGKIKGVRVNDGILIDFYIEYEDIMAPGDKISYFSALKGIVSDVIEDEYAPYVMGKPDKKIDAVLSAIGMYKRMCLDYFKVGALCKVVIERKEQLAEKYLDDFKQELKKL